MVDLKNQRRMASEILKCDRDRVWLDPNRMDEIAEAVTRSDIRSLINSRAIVSKQRKGISRGRARKNIALKNHANGIKDNACGNTTNANPGPDVTTSPNPVPSVVAIYPKTEKTTNPANMLIPASANDVIAASPVVFSVFLV